MHTCATKLKIGASEVAASSVVDTVEDADTRRILRVSTFNLGTPASSYQIIHTGTTASVIDLFHVGNRYDQVF